MNVDKRKTVHFFNDRSNQVVFSSVGNLYRIFSAVCSHTAFAVRYPFGCLPAAGCFRYAGKAGCPAQIPAGCRAVFRPVQRISQYDANALQPLPCIYTPSRRTLVRRDGKIFQRTSQPFAGGGLASHFSYQAVDKTLTFHFLRATLELPTGQYWPRGNICLGGSLCRKLKKKR